MSGLIGWFVRNRLAADVITIAVLLGGLFATPHIQREVTPTSEVRRIEVELQWPGAPPELIAQRVLQPIEVELRGVEGIARSLAIAVPDCGRVVAELDDRVDVDAVLSAVRQRMSARMAFPADSLTPLVREALVEQPVLSLALSGAIPEADLDALGLALRDRLLSAPPIERVVLQRLGRGEVAGRDLAGHSLQPCGINASWVSSSPLYFDGRPAVLLQILAAGRQDSIAVAKAARTQIAAFLAQTQADVRPTIWRDLSSVFDARIKTLVYNGLQSLAVAFGLLWLFSQRALAVGVCSGIVLALLAALCSMKLLGVSLNMVSLFGFVMVTATLANNGIVVAEAIRVARERGLQQAQAAVEGVGAVGAPLWVATGVNILMFVPMLDLPGEQAALWANFPAVVILAYLTSLLGSLLFLPVRMAGPSAAPVREHWRRWSQIQQRCSGLIDSQLRRGYAAVLSLALRRPWRVLVLAAGAGLLTALLMLGGQSKWEPLPPVVADAVIAEVRINGPLAGDALASIVDAIEARLREVARSVANGQPSPLLHIVRMVNEVIEPGAATSTGYSVRLYLALEANDSRSIDGRTLAERWRVALASIPDVHAVRMDYMLGVGGPEIAIRLHAPQDSVLAEAKLELRQAFARYPGLYAITDSEHGSDPRIDISLEPEAEALGLTTADLPHQLWRGLFSGDATSAHSTGLRITRIDGQRTAELSARVDPHESVSATVRDDLRLNVLPLLAQKYPGLSWDDLGSAPQPQRPDIALGGTGVLVLGGALIVSCLLFRIWRQAVLMLAVLPFVMTGALLMLITLRMTVSLLSMMGLVAALGICVTESLILFHYVQRALDAGHGRQAAIADAAMSRLRPVVLTLLVSVAGLIPLLSETSAQAAVLIPLAVALVIGVLSSSVVTLVLLPAMMRLLWPAANDPRPASPSSSTRRIDR